MTADLRTQRDDIVRARDLMDSRRRFTEAVLAGASAGVIGGRQPSQHDRPVTNHLALELLSYLCCGETHYMNCLIVLWSHAEARPFVEPRHPILSNGGSG